MNKNTISMCLVLSVGIFASTSLAQQPSPAFTLERVTEMYIQFSPELQAARQKVERIRADQIDARLRPNPGITVTAENLPLSGPTPFGRLYEVAATYSETIELGGKRNLRVEAADQAVSVAEARYEDAAWRGLAEVKHLYYAALVARYNVDIAGEDRQTLDQLVRFNIVRFQEGAIPEADLIKVRLERMRFDAAVRHAELTLRQATIRLAEKVGAPSVSGRTIEGALTLQPVTLNRDALHELALSERADVRAAGREVDAALARLNLETARAKPDLTPFAGFKRIGNDNTVLVGVTVPLKLHGRNQAGIARAQADVKAAQAQLQLVRNRVFAEVDVAFEAVQTARDMAQAFQSELLGQTDESRTITLAAYEEGGTDLLPVLEAQRTRVEVRREYFKTLFDYWTSIVALELAVGRDLQP